MPNKPRVLLLHWKEDEMPDLKARIPARFRVDTCVPVDGEGMKTLRDLAPPDLLLICLDRLPSHGHAVAHHYRNRKATRAVPILFVGGTPDKVAKIRAAMPGFAFADWDRVADAVEQALYTTPPAAAPAVPSTRPLHAKIGLKPDMRIALLGAPAPLETLIPDLPANLHLQEEPTESTDLTLCFARNDADAQECFDAVAAAMRKPRLWIFYRRKRLSWLSLSECAARRGLAQYKVMGLNAEWSGVAFGKRRAG